MVTLARARTVPLALAVALALAPACGADDAVAPAGAAAGDVADGGGFVFDGFGGEIHFGGPDVPDVRVPDAGGGEVDASDPSAWPPCDGAGSPGCTCAQGDDCASGFCVPTADGKVCTDYCWDSQCPQGWSCVNGGSGPDVIFVCASLHKELCRPCATGADCGGELGGWCLQRPDGLGSFCGADCDAERPCPSGYACELVPVGGDTEVEQCVPTSGECTCSANATKQGASTPCTLTNELGTCTGARTCSPSGLTECDAPPPAAETCNGADDDCNGIVDDALDGACVRTNAFGTCAGQRACTAGQWGACDASEPAVEACNGADDDCDGLADDGYEDTDGDGLADCVDGDDDDDGVLDGDDLCPLVADPEQADQDDDQVGDACDPDIDGDGAANADDCAPSDPAWVCTIHFWDGDDDGVGKCTVQKCLCGPTDHYTLTVCTVTDCDDADATIAPGLPELCDGADNDCDGQKDEGVPDTDGDGLMNACDPDDDGDGRPDGLDNCPLVSNPGQEDADADGIGDVCDGDVDGDGVDETVDDCPGVWNPDQADCDGNGVGDACDGPDNDGDGIACEDDLCPLQYDPGQEDCDGDGAGDACDADDDDDGTPDTADCGPCDPAVHKDATEACNGKDDDCDGKTDEGFAALGAPCDGPDADLCKGGVMVCGPAGQGTVCGETGEGQVEACNGLDDDCDGAVDEDVPGTGLPCDGDDGDLCEDGLVVCAPDGSGAVCDDPGPDAVELCNGADDDCDGAIDEDFEDLGAPCDGADGDLCATGTIVCLADGSGATCDEAGAGTTEACNGADDDCDGAVDEDFPGLGGPCDGPDADKCADGTLACAGDGLSTTCLGDTLDSKVETCNGLDDDCDGSIDEDFFALGAACDGPDADGCANGVVACSADGTGIACDEPPDAALVEVCNGKDDDCDGTVDEDWPDVGAPCDGPDADSCPRGAFVCAAGGDGTVCEEVGKPVTLETCNGKDDDCDGAVDEDWPDVGTGCDGPDFDLCAGGKVVCGADGQSTVCDDPGGGAPEICDGVDNNCDGFTDEAFEFLGDPCDSDDADLCKLGTFVCAPTKDAVICKETLVDQVELCDGLDNDCDGATDELWPTLGTPCDGPDSDSCPLGAVVCGAGGTNTACLETGVPFVELCNGKDDDCDGAVDEVFVTLGTPCDGPDADACPNGVVACGADLLPSDCVGDGPVVEVCNGVDDDCDGSVDEGFPLGLLCDGADSDLCDNGVVVCAPDGGTECAEANDGILETCNGLDDDCDGSVDEDWPDLGQPCDGPDVDACANGVVVCDGGGGAVCGVESVEGLLEDCGTPGDDDCDGLENEGCAAGTVRLAFPSVALPRTLPVGATFGIEAGVGEAGVVGPALGGPGASYGVRLGGVVLP